MEIPPEIITNILHRLPAKSLGRFRRVSKNWLAQISEPQFIKAHQNTHNHNHLICDSINGSLYSIPFNQHEENPKKLTLKLPRSDLFIFHGSCNGLVLGSADDFVNAHSLIVLNPTTKEFVELPESDYEMINNLLEIDIMYGFGYDSLTDDYKVVTISYFHYNYLIPPDNMSVHVYSLRNKTWKWVIDSPYDHSHGKSLPGVFVNGFLHWIANKGSDHLPVIVAFSLADEKFSEVASPNLGDNDIMSRSDCRLVVGGEKLGIFVEDEMWLMNEYAVRESWSKILIHGFNEIPVVEPKIFCDDGKIVLVSGDRMWIYDVEGKSFCKSIDLSGNVKGSKVKGAYVESLVSPKFS
ncbi:hypothetical protein L1987_72353 [Smallanthus sonchifolius]|uniref:Uncharacterized protein n=1 Tax=Smallanthus sonchifolius TaxID=185202 RepID=A0ACB9AU54_9ASTR|nr:hypothetical protein L1987_72353 [Smallanthus sonchifolius]